jgi:hypothetical protein
VNLYLFEVKNALDFKRLQINLLLSAVLIFPRARSIYSISTKDVSRTRRSRRYSFPRLS